MGQDRLCREASPNNSGHTRNASSIPHIGAVAKNKNAPTTITIHGMPLFAPTLKTAQYPTLVGIGLDICAQSGSAEIGFLPHVSVLLHVTKSRRDIYDKCNEVIRHAVHPPGAVAVPPSSVLPRFCLGAASMEARYYMDLKHVHSQRGGFISCRMGTSGNIGLGVGYRSPTSSTGWTPRMGIAYNALTGNVQPFLGFTLSYGMDE